MPVRGCDQVNLAHLSAARAPVRRDLDRHGAPYILSLIGWQCFEAGAELAPCRYGIALQIAGTFLLSRDMCPN
jgi:hypothetical protein